MIRYQDWVNESWKMFSSQWLKWAAVSLIVVCFNYAAVGLLGAPAWLSFGVLSAVESGIDPLPVFPLPLMIGSVLLGSVLVVFLPPLMAGVYVAAFNQMRTGKLEVGDVWKGMRFFWQTNLYLCVVGSLIFIGFMFCLVPGVYLGVCGFFSYPLMVEKKLGFWAAYTESREMARKDFWNVLLYAALTGIIGTLGGTCGPLTLATMPFLFLMRAVAYRDLFGVEGAVAYPPPSADGGGSHINRGAGAGLEHAPGAPPQRAFAYCPQCGTATRATDLFCMSCGFGLKG